MTTYPLEPGPERMQELGKAALDWVTGIVEGRPAPRPTGGARAPRVRTPRCSKRCWPSRVRTRRSSASCSPCSNSRPRNDRTAAPAYLGYVPGGGFYVSALAEFLARSANRFTGLAATAPELAAMEHGVLRWLSGPSACPRRWAA